MTGKEGTKKSKAEILKEGFAMLDAEYGDKLTEQTRIYKKELFKKIIGEYPTEKIMRMCIKLIKTRKYSNFPKVAEMIELIEGNKEEESELALIYLKEKLIKKGYYQSVSFPECPATAGVIEIWGGWPKFCDEMTNDKEKWIKKEFMKIYPIMKKKGGYPLYNPGYFEITNTGKGYEDHEMMATFGMGIDGRKAKKKKSIQEGVKPIKENQK